MIRVEQVRKCFNRTRALDGFSLRVEKGELAGLVGPNGAGKTTLIKILSTLLDPQAGEVLVGGMNVTAREQDVKRIVGYMPDQEGLYQDMRVREFLNFFAEAFHLSRPERLAAVSAGLERSGLTQRSEAFIEELSFGTKQRLFLAKTLLHGPRLLLLDEPATGLDPLARIELRHLLKELNAQGITILISSHILADLEDICTRVVLIGEGKNVGEGRVESTAETLPPGSSTGVYEIEVLGSAAPAAELAAQFAGARVLESHGSRVVVTIQGGAPQAPRLLRHLVTGGIEVIRFDRPSEGLEERYRKAFGGER